MLLLALLAAVGFAASAYYHIAAYGARPDPLPMWIVVTLHVGVMVLFIPMITSAPAKHARAKAPIGRGRSDRLLGLPPGIATIGTALFVYTLLNFAVCGILMAWDGVGQPWIDENGRYHVGKGTHARLADDEEYWLAVSRQQRMWSGHWTTFYFFEASMLAAYWVRQHRSKQSDEAE